MSARALASQGAKVFITGRRLPVLQGAVQAHNADVGKHGGELIPIQMDVSDKQSLQDGVSKVTQQAGKLHILINNAGVEGPVTKFTPDDFNKGDDDELKRATLYAQRQWDNEQFQDWDSVFKANTHAVHFTSLAFLPLLVKGNADPPTKHKQNVDKFNKWTASIINITSISGLVHIAQNHYAYNASKAAANSLTRMLAHELKFSVGANVRVSACCPGLVTTEMTTKKSSLESGGQSSINDLDPTMSNPAGRVGLEEDIAQAILLLAANLFITGVVLPVDGGFVTA